MTTKVVSIWRDTTTVQIGIFLMRFNGFFSCKKRSSSQKRLAFNICQGVDFETMEHPPALCSALFGFLSQQRFVHTLHSIWFIRDFVFDFSTGNLLFLPKFEYSCLLDVSYFLGFSYLWNLNLKPKAKPETLNQKPQSSWSCQSRIHTEVIFFGKT